MGGKTITEGSLKKSRSSSNESPHPVIKSAQLKSSIISASDRGTSPNPTKMIIRVNQNLIQPKPKHILR
jgi:hypothetical protein